MKMSQRLFTTIIAFVVVMLVVGVAYANHVLPALSDLQNQVWTLLTPLAGVLFALNTYLSVIDSKVADGTYAAGDIGALLRTPDFYTAMITVGVGAAQAFGLKVMDSNEQTLLVNMLMALAGIVLSSFVTRTPTSPQTVAAKLSPAITAAALPVPPPSTTP